MDAIVGQIEKIEASSDFSGAVTQWRRALESIRHAAGRYQAGEDEAWTDLRLRCLEGLAYSYWIVGRWDDALSEWEEALALGTAATSRRAIIQARLGTFEIYNAIGHSRMARTCLSAAALQLQDKVDDDLMVLTAVLQSSIASKAGQIGTAEQLLKSSQQAAVKLHETPLARRAQSRAAVEEAVGFFRKGDYAQSLHRLTIAVEILGQEKSQERVEAMRFIGVTLGMMGRRREGLHYFEQALSLATEMGFRLGEAKVCNGIGQAFMEQAQSALSIYYFERGLRICDQVGARVEGAALLGKLGQAYLQEERFEDAVRIFRRDLEISRMSGNVRILGHSHLNLGMSLSGGRTDEEALQAFREAVRCFEQVDDQMNLGRALLAQCKTQLRLGDYAEAEHASRTALAILKPVGQASRQAQAHALVATTLRHAGRPADSIPDFEAAITLFEKTGPCMEHAYCLFEFGRAAESLQRVKEASGWYGQAVKMAVQLGLRSATTRYLEALAAVDDASALGALADVVTGETVEPALTASASA